MVCSTIIKISETIFFSSNHLYQFSYRYFLTMLGHSRFPPKLYLSLICTIHFPPNHKLVGSYLTTFQIIFVGHVMCVLRQVFLYSHIIAVISYIHYTAPKSNFVQVQTYKETLVKK